MWWKENAIYQIYPRSFNDSNGDGIGDIRGIIEKLDYLKDLGVGIVWLSPVYESPGDDNGYDISHYQRIMPEFGTLADMDELIAGLHTRGIKLLMDLVVNHTSDEHEWFQASRKSKDSRYRDYYIWRPNIDGTPPNNWASVFGGSAWTLDEATNEWYLHLFSKKQPDLNWENKAVRHEIHEMMRWWLDRGVDGFRMDVINMISKEPGLPDAPVTSDNKYHLDISLITHGPRLEEFLLEIKDKVLSGHDAMTVGEMPAVSTAQAQRITDEVNGSLSMVFHFEHVDLDIAPGASSKFEVGPLHLTELKQVLSKWQNDLDTAGWNSIYLSNHDQPRSVSRFGDDGQYHAESAKMLATLTHLQKGTPYIYQGEEIGMTNIPMSHIDEYRDIESINLYKEWVEEKGKSTEETLAAIYQKGRDNSRTPFQWNGSRQAGFTSGEPWIKVNPNHKTINAAAASADPDSILNYYKQLIQLRKDRPIVTYGRFDLILAEHESIFAFTRTFGEEKLLVLLNFSAETARFKLPKEIKFKCKEVLLANYSQPENKDFADHILRPYEACVYLGI
ncbi:MAG: alpha-glucosidase [Chloroflexota bacterium]